MAKKIEVIEKNLNAKFTKSVHQQSFFAIFWALAMYFNGFRQGIHLDSGLNGFIGILVFTSATILLMKPSSNFRLIALAFLGSIDFLNRLPQMPNHFFILGISNIAIFLCWIFSQKKNRHSHDWFINLIPFLRLSFVTIYGFAALAKLNTGFFETENSCAFVLANREFEWMNINFDFNKVSFFPHLISATELIIFSGLLFRRTNPYAIAIACLFHTSLSLTPISQGLGFTFVLLALLSLFVAENVQSTVILKAREKQQKLDKKIPLDSLKLIYSFISISIAIGWLVVTRSETMNLAIRWIFSLVVLAVAAFYIGFIVLKRRNELVSSKLFGLKNGIQTLIFVLVLVTGLSPYLGLKTRPTFTMYSNLTVENNSTNHLFIPRIWQNNLADDVVTILSSSDPELSQDAAGGVKWVYLELQKKLAKYPDTQIAFTRGGENFSFEKASDSPELVNPNWFLAKTLAFRKIYPTNYCSW